MCGRFTQPVWNWLPHEAARVYRLQTDQGERVIGWLVTPASVAMSLRRPAPARQPSRRAAAIAAVMQAGTGLDLAQGLVLKRSLVMNRHRFELTGFSDSRRGVREAGGSKETSRL